MQRPYALDIIMLEDKPEYQGSFEALASKERIIVKTSDNAEDLISFIRERPRKYKFIVLDARAFFTEGDPHGSESETNLIYVFREIKNLEKEHGVVLKYAINTGFADIKITHGKVVDCPIFDKGNESSLFEYIWEVQNESKEYFVKNKFPEVVPLYDNFFTDKVQEKVISLYNDHAYNNASLVARLDNLSCLRMINEQMMDVLLLELAGKTWEDITSNKGSRSEAIALYLGETDVISNTLQHLSINIYRTTSKYGGHSEEDIREDSEFPTYRMIAALAMALLELFKTANNLLNL